jgi:hypothetical protein
MHSRSGERHRARRHARLRHADPCPLRAPVEVERAVVTRVPPGPLAERVVAAVSGGAGAAEAQPAGATGAVSAAVASTSPAP